MPPDPIGMSQVKPAVNVSDVSGSRTAVAAGIHGDLRVVLDVVIRNARASRSWPEEPG